MDDLKCKIFRDPVHGNILIDKWVCDAFVDSDVFQRLRFVEQSSVRLLYPGARHDRFIHSIGVFHVAKKILNQVMHQFWDAGVNKKDCEKLRNCFLSAALLHDCAHSPFSHTGEELATLYCGERIEKLLVNVVHSPSFENDFYEAQENLHTHELASAYVAIRSFSKHFQTYSIDKEQFARMIIGVRNKNTGQNKLLMAYNCLIRLINGFVIDADRLDYLMRDTWATGVCNASVDVDRLIAGLELDVNKGVVCFRASALSSVVNAVAARDYIYTWILPHHKVALANLLLDKSMRALVAALSKSTQASQVKGNRMTDAQVGDLLFSPRRLIRGSAKWVSGEVISLPSDGDLLYLMKKFIPKNPYVVAYLSREKRFVSLWKTYAEFSQIFSVENVDDECLLQDKSFWELFCSKIMQSNINRYVICTDVNKIKQTAGDLGKVEVYGPDSNQGGRGMRYELSRLLPARCSNKYYFYVYIKKSEASKKAQVIRTLKKLFNQVLEDYRHMC